MSLASIVLKLSPKLEYPIHHRVIGGEEFNICEIQITYDNPKKSELSVELPLENDKFMFLQKQDLEFWELCKKVEKGLYSEFYTVKNNVHFRSIVDNGHRFEARVIPDSLVDIVLHLGHNQSGHNGY